MAAFLDGYLKLGLENAPSSSSSNTGGGGGGGAASSALVRAHFQLLAGVCIEFCLATGRLDRLYAHAFGGFLQAGQVRRFIRSLMDAVDTHHEREYKNGGAGRSVLSYIRTPTKQQIQARTFLETLEPYILTDKLRHVAPEPLAALLELCVERGEPAAAERCLLHLDPRGLDFDHVLALLR